MLGGGMGALWTSMALLAVVHAGPLHRYSRETSEDYQNIDLSAYANYTANEVCFSDNQVFQKGDLMPNPGPCEECKCEPPSIVCNMIKCPVNNNGCRTIQRPNHCCPDYNCECDYNGQLYNDGERIDLPEEPCQVCYCKGGDVMCTSITCYQRDDCEPLHVPGQCCPKYENCPLRDMAATNTDDKNLRPRSPNRTSNNGPKRDMQPWLLTKSALPTSSLPLPKHPADTTTEGGNIIIVSDWLTERRSTTEDNVPGVNHTDSPAVVTDLEDISTNQQIVNTKLPDRNEVRKSETITPLDEVIFTRVDMLRGHPEGSIDLSTPVHLQDEETTDFPTMESVTDIHSSTTQDEQVTTLYSTIVDDIGLPMKNLANDLSQNENNSFTSDSVSDENSHTTISDSTEPTATVPNDLQTTVNNELSVDKSKSQDKYVIKESKDKEDIMFSTTTVPSENKDNLLFIDTTPKDENDLTSLENSKVNNKSILDARSDSNFDQSSEEITLENMFGLDNSFEKQDEANTTTNAPSTEKNQNNIQSTTTDEGVTGIDEILIGQELMKDRSSGENEKVLDISKESVDDIEKDSMVSVKQSNSEETTATTVSSLNVDLTTPFFTEDHMTEVFLEAGQPIQGDSNIEEERFDSEELTTESPEAKEHVLVGPVSSSNDTSKEMDKMKQKDIAGSRENSEDTETSTILALSSEENNNNEDSVIPNVNNEFSLVKSAVVDLEEATTNNPLLIETTKYTSEEVSDHNELENQEDLNVSSEEKDVELFAMNKEYSSSESKEVDVPPVLELNSNVPFLQLGGHGISDSSLGVTSNVHKTTTPGEKNLELNNDSLKLENSPGMTFSTSRNTELYNGTKDTVSSSVTERLELSIGVQSSQTKEEMSNVETDNGSTEAPSHIPLTPGDLKVLAEYLISETIKPAASNNGSTYTSNKWLKGNLTSEEKMASILSAANISIGIMNRTDIAARLIQPETSTKTNEVIKLDKEAKFKGNSISEGDDDKNGNLHTKVYNNQEFQKNNLKVQIIKTYGDDLSLTPPPTAVTDVQTEKPLENDFLNNLTLVERLSIIPKDIIKGDHLTPEKLHMNNASHPIQENISHFQEIQQTQDDQFRRAPDSERKNTLRLVLVNNNLTITQDNVNKSTEVQ